MTVLLIASSHRVLLIAPCILPDGACGLILLSKLSIDFDPSRATACTPSGDYCDCKPRGVLLDRELASCSLAVTKVGRDSDLLPANVL